MMTKGTAHHHRGRPTKPEAQRVRTISVTLPPDMALKLNQTADQLGLTRSALVKQYVKKCMS